MPYTVIKPFTYEGRHLERDAPWTPTGNKMDAAIIRSRMVLDVSVDLHIQRATTDVAKPIKPRGRRVGT